MVKATLDFELDGKLAAGRKRLQELIVTRDESARTVRELQADLAKAEAAAKTEAEQALIDGREPSRKLLAAPGTLTAQLHSAMAQSNTAAGAAQRQRAIVEGLEAEIAAGKRARNLATVQPMGVELATALDRASDLAGRIVRACGAEQITGPELFPGDDPALVIEGRCRAMGVLLSLLRDRAMFSPELRRELGWVDSQEAA